MEKVRLTNRRKESNISQATIAEKLCMDVSSYNRREKGQVKISPQEWEKLSGIAGVVGMQYNGAIYIETDTFTATPGLRIYSAHNGMLLVKVDSSWFGNIL